MMASLRVPVAYAAGKPGNVIFDNPSKERPGDEKELRTRPNSFVGRAGSGQGNPGEGTGEAVGHSPDLNRRPAEGQRGSGDGSGAGRQGDHGTGRAGSRFPGGTDG